MLWTETSYYQEYVYGQNGASEKYFNYTDVARYTFTSFSAGARINFHFGPGEKIDPYAGFAVGYTDGKLKQKFSSDNPAYTKPADRSYDPIPVYLAATFGIRYYFTKNAGVYTEVGLEKWAPIQAGVLIKFMKKNKTFSDF